MRIDDLRRGGAAFDDATAYRVIWSLGTSPVALQNQLRGAVSRKAPPVELARAYLGADPGVPVGQGYELYTALNELKVETQMVVYPREGHHPRVRPPARPAAAGAGVV